MALIRRVKRLVRSLCGTFFFFFFERNSCAGSRAQPLVFSVFFVCLPEMCCLSFDSLSVWRFPYFCLFLRRRKKERSETEKKTKEEEIEKE